MKKSSFIISLLTVVLFFFIIVTLPHSYQSLSLLCLIGGVGAIILVLWPQLLNYLYLVSMFIGVTYIKGSIGISPLDLLFPLWVIYNSKYFKEKLPPDIRLVYYSLVFFCLNIFIGLLFNFFLHPLKNSIAMVWYLYRSIQLPITLYIMFNYLKHNKTEINRYINLLLLFSLVQIPIVLLQHLHSTGDAVQTGVHGMLLPHHSLIAMVFLTLLPIFISIIINKENIFWKMLGVALLVSSLYIIIVSGSRSVLLGLFTFCVLVFLNNLKLNKSTIVTILLTPLMVIFIIKFTPLQAIYMKTFHSEATLDGSSLSRFLIWKGAIDNFIQAPIIQKIFGYGAGMYRTLTYNFVIWSGSKSAVGAHNNILMVLVETGVMGLILFIYHFFIIIYTGLKNYKGKYNCKYLIFASLGLIISGITQETFWFQSAFGSYWTFYIIILKISFTICVECNKT